MSTENKGEKKTSTRGSRGSAGRKSSNSAAAKKKRAARNSHIIYEIKLILLLAFTVLSIISLFTGLAGNFGKTVHDMYLGFFSVVGFIMPFVITAIIFMQMNKNMTSEKYKFIFALISMVTGLVLLKYAFSMAGSNPHMNALNMKIDADFLLSSMLGGLSFKGGGIVGDLLGYLVYKSMGIAGCFVISITFILIAIVTGTKISLEKMFDSSLRAVKTAADKSTKIAGELAEKNRIYQENRQREKELAEIESEEADKSLFEGEAAEIEPEDESTQSDNLSITYYENEADFTDKEPTLVDHELFDHGEEVGEVAVTDYESHEPGFEIEIEPSPEPEESTEERDSVNIYGYFGEMEEVVGEKKDDRESEGESIIKESVQTTLPPRQTGRRRYKLPPVTLLKKVPIGKSDDGKALNRKAKILEDTLRSFGVDIKVTNITKGPAITMFELLPAPGVKVSKIVNLSDDIALNLAAPQIRIIAPIPGKSAVGVEIPNEVASVVTLREVMDISDIKNAHSKLTFALGKDIHGNAVIGDLAKMPHLLIAGSTGSGKSVCVNTLITGILLNATPDEVKFLMIDPKVVELNIYNGIPHLLLPVVTDPKKASMALNWAVSEMTRRYNLFAESGTKDIAAYNGKAESGVLGDEAEKLPKIVVIIDELADLMMVAPNQIEDAICRLAQMARAAGIHLLVATQRPSVDVITGLIKANIPSRIAFAVSSQIDSRTILDMAGAEKLLGKGDMLYHPIGSNKPCRVQGAYVSDGEVTKVLEYIRDQYVGEPEYNEDIISQTLGNGDSYEDEADELLGQSIELCIQSKQASASMLQRKFRIGYNRAARIVDQMEERGIVSSAQGSKGREVLVDESYLDNV